MPRLAALALCSLFATLPAYAEGINAYVESRSTSGLGFDGPDIGVRLEYSPVGWLRLEGAGFSSQKIEVKDHGRGSLVEGAVVARYPWRRLYAGGALFASRLDTGRWTKSGEGLEGVLGWQSTETRLEARVAQDADYWYASYRQAILSRLLVRMEYGQQDFLCCPTGSGAKRHGQWLSVGVGWAFPRPRRAVRVAE